MILWNLNFSNFSKWDLNTNFIRQSNITILGFNWRIDYFFKINIAGVSMTFPITYLWQLNKKFKKRNIYKRLLPACNAHTIDNQFRLTENLQFTPHYCWLVVLGLIKAWTLKRWDQIWFQHKTEKWPLNRNWF